MVNPKIFISYRRADSQDFTDRLFDYMAKHFGAENVFQDVGDSSKIPLGVDFVEYLADQVQACDVVLVVIGEQWTRILQDRARRDDDFVRIEVESALAQGKLVVPVLKSATQMPTSDALPESIRKLARLNASRVRPNPDFVRDCETLADGIKAVFNKQSPKPIPTRPTSESLMPAPFAWVEIPGGQGMMKTDTEGVTLAIPTERYWIAKYPVTNAQFAKFIEAGGYNEKRWWTEAGWSLGPGDNWTQPLYWTDTKWNGAEQPVTGIKWFEAVAFCLWLSDMTGEDIMLPTEAQWQYAAQGNDGRAYPWGNEWDSARCRNSVDGGYGSAGNTSPVRQYEGKGDSPFGVVDMAGNVWEWCLTDPDNQTNDVQSAAETRVFRGGTWNLHNPSIFRCECRSHDFPSYAGVNLRGFRIART